MDKGKLLDRERGKNFKHSILMLCNAHTDTPVHRHTYPTHAERLFKVTRGERDILDQMDSGSQNLSEDI